MWKAAFAPQRSADPRTGWPVTRPFWQIFSVGVRISAKAQVPNRGDAEHKSIVRGKRTSQVAPKSEPAPVGRIPHKCKINHKS